MSIDDLPRFPCPPSASRTAVEAAHEAIDLQVQRSTIAAKRSLGFSVEEDEYELHYAESAAEHFEELRSTRHVDACNAHEYGTLRPRECSYAWMVKGSRPDLSVAELKAQALHWRKRFDSDRNSDSYSDDGGDGAQSGPSATDMCLDFMAALSDADVAELLRGEEFGGHWTVEDVRNIEARTVSEGCLVEPDWLQAILAGSAEQTTLLARDAILTMGHSGFSPSFTGAAQWLRDRVLHKMPVSVEVGLAFLQVLAERDVIARMPDESEQLLARRIDALPGIGQFSRNAGNWAVATQVFLTARMMSDVVARSTAGCSSIAPDAPASDASMAPRRSRRIRV
jgi:hypothetical protein